MRCDIESIECSLLNKYTDYYCMHSVVILQWEHIYIHSKSSLASESNRSRVGFSSRPLNLKGRSPCPFGRARKQICIFF